MAMPSEQNTELITKIIEVTGHEQFFKDYCKEKVLAHAKQNRWSKEKTDDILSSIQFRYYSSTIYNSYALYTTSQLRKLLDALTQLNKQLKTDEPFILTNSIMQNNLDLFIKALLEGKYVTKNNKILSEP